jgi:hypothetical protein
MRWIVLCMGVCSAICLPKLTSAAEFTGLGVEFSEVRGMSADGSVLVGGLYDGPSKSTSVGSVENPVCSGPG